MRLPHGSFTRTNRRAGLATALLAAAGAAVLVLPASPGSAQRTDAAAAADPAKQPAVEQLAQERGIPAAEAARRIDAQPAQSALADRLTAQLGARSAGAFIDQASGDLFVNVLDRAAAGAVTAAGAKAKIVAHSAARLDGVKAQLDRSSAVPNTSWGVDVTTNTVTVQVPAGARDAATNAFVKRLGTYGSAVRVERVAAGVSIHAFYGGQAIYGGGSRCSSAFNARSGSTYYVITAGHCTRAITSWRTSSQPIGNSVARRFPGDDYGTIRVNSPSSLDPRGAIINYGSPRTITGSRSAYVGQSVCKTGSTTGTTCGTVQRTNVTVNYAEGAVYGMIQSNTCTQPGDSGGGLYAGSRAVGIVSGGSIGGCGGSFRSFFQPIGEVLDVLGLSLL
jgi:streptogrisin D